MKILDIFSLFRQGKKAFGDGLTWTQITGGPDVVERNLLANNKEWVFIATDRNAQAVSNVRFRVMRYQNNSDDQEVFDGPFVDFMENPALGFTFKQFVYLHTAYKELTGNALWEVDGKVLKPLIPTSCSPVVKNGELLGIRYTGEGTERVINISRVLHDRYVDPAKPYWGVGKLSKIASWVDTQSYTNEFLRKFFINGAQFGGFIETDEDNEERIKLIKLGLFNDHVGVANSHKWGVLPRGAKASQATSKISDMEMGATDDRFRDKILATFGVPKNLLGLTAGENRATVEGTEYTYSKYVVKPIVQDFVEFLNKNIAARLDPTGRYYFDFEEFVPVNMDIEIRARQAALNNQAYKTVNEVRAEAGLPPVPGGDAIYGAPFQVPLGSPAPQIAPTAPTDGDLTDEPDEPKKAMPRAVRDDLRTKRAVSTVIKAVEEVLSEPQMIDAVAHKNFVARVEAHEKQIAEKVRSFNNEQARKVTLDLTSMTKAVAKGDVFDMEEEVGAMINVVAPLLRSLMLEQAIEEYVTQGYAGEFDPQAAGISRAVELAAKRLAKSYNDTTAELIKSTLNEGVTNGEDISQLTERIASVYEYSDTVRAELVARTETVYIANEGSKEAYRQSGVVKSMRWYTAEDEMVCEFCGPMNGRIVGINEAFFKKGEAIPGSDGSSMSTDYRAIDVPPLHPNCRCFIRPEQIEV